MLMTYVTILNTSIETFFLVGERWREREGKITEELLCPVLQVKPGSSDWIFVHDNACALLGAPLPY